MEDSEQTFNDDEDDDDDDTIYDDSEKSLDMFILYIIKKFDVSTKRMILSMLLGGMGAEDRRDPFGLGSRDVVIELSGECKSRIEDLVDSADMILFRTLSKKQRELYNRFSGIRFFIGRSMTASGYIEIINTCNSLARLTGLPFSIEEKYGGLKDWDEWNDAIERALKDGREKFGRKGKKGK